MRLYNKICCIITVISLVGCASIQKKNDLWQTEKLEPISPEAQITPQWQVRVGSSGRDKTLRLVPAIRGNAIYTADSHGRIMKLDKNDGHTIWSANLKQSITGGVSVDAHHVYVASSQGNLYALSVDNGEVKYHHRLSSQMLAPVASNDTLVVAHTIDGNVTAFTANNGEKKWTYYGTPPLLTLRGSSTPVIVQNYVLIGLANGRVALLDVNTGFEQWQHAVAVPRGRSELQRLVDIKAKVLIEKNILYAVSYQGKALAVNMQQGRDIWSKSISSYHNPALDYAGLYLTDDKNVVYAIDKRSGNTLWKQDILHQRQLTGPAVLNDVLVVGDMDGYLHLLSTEDGHLMARFKAASDAINSAPAIEGNTLYLYDQSGLLQALQIEVLDGVSA